MDEQIQHYSAGIEAPSALYWRARIYEDQEHNLSAGGELLSRSLRVLRQLLLCAACPATADGAGLAVCCAPAAVLSAVRPAPVADLTGELPEDDTHLIKARLLANAALNEYISPEIMASPTSSQWGALARLRSTSLRRVHPRVAVDEAQWPVLFRHAHGAGTYRLLESAFSAAVLVGSGGEL